MLGGNTANQVFPFFLEDNSLYYDSNASTQLRLFGNSFRNDLWRNDELHKSYLILEVGGIWFWIFCLYDVSDIIWFIENESVHILRNLDALVLEINKTPQTIHKVQETTFFTGIALKACLASKTIPFFQYPSTIELQVTA
ncbi:hypothetical protein M5K25_003971 [Dendrobium thyrsiflorum]|uniref:Uncharacterized protein n=1 Tax=Dendrobium thyrsiflorum TaxID=117978 RepID=A0ABD0VSU3_DENTH